MLSSLQSHEEEEEPTTNPTTTSFIPTTPSQFLIPTSASPRQILMRCAELMHHGDRPMALRIASFLISAVSPIGDSSDRVVYHFAQALTRLIESSNAASSPSTSMNKCGTQLVQPSYLAFNQITPFLRFAHLTANQAILEAIDGHRGVHIIDMDTAHGFQWPPLLQAIAVHGYRGDGSPPSVRITGAGTDVNALRRTADRLHAFARSLGLPFQFNPLYLHSYNLGSSLMQLHQSSSSTEKGEVLIVNCVLFLHKLLYGDRDERQLHDFLSTVRAMGPAVVTIAERELGVASAPQDFFRVFSESLEYYTAIFEALEATVQPNSVERREVEERWLGEEIKESLVPAGGTRGAGGMRFERWDVIMRENGFTPRRLSEYSLSQARLLLRLHYPSEGYQLHVSKEGLFLGWQTRALFSVSSWQ
ncbi:GRAS family transcription factor [Rhynchospora pubera]|uniref:GRAS family transcription factor n=1 Tax=Rhynchospora pubera TaxID=906938 RepID=A0AAV8CUT3_9POAL|nr:GRAS family transcription factor [Rhynchospora pubera]